MEDHNKRWEFDNEMTQYRDAYGFPSGAKLQHDPSGNALMFLGEEAVILADLGIRIDDVVNFYRCANLCQIESGNYRRTPKGCFYSEDQEGWDDFIGLTTGIAILFSKTTATGTLSATLTDIVEFGRRHRFRWNFLSLPYCYPTYENAPAETDDVASWFGRYLQFVAHLKWAVFETPNPLERLVWCLSVAFAGLFNTKAQDPWRITYMMVRLQRLRRRPWQPEILAEKIWRWRFLRAWPGGIAAVRARYFGDNNHPLAVFASMEF